MSKQIFHLALPKTELCLIGRKKIMKTCLIWLIVFLKHYILGSVSSTSSHQFSSTSLLYQRVQALSTVNQKVGTNMGTTKSIDTHHSRAASLDVDEPNQRGYYRTNSSLIRYKESDIHSRRSSLTEEGSSSGCYSDPTSCSSQVYFHFITNRW